MIRMRLRLSEDGEDGKMEWKMGSSTETLPFLRHDAIPNSGMTQLQGRVSSTYDVFNLVIMNIFTIREQYNTIVNTM